MSVIPGEKCVSTGFRWLNNINCIIDDELEAFVQQSFNQCGPGNPLSICLKNKCTTNAFIAMIQLRLMPTANGFLAAFANKHNKN